MSRVARTSALVVLLLVVAMMGSAAIYMLGPARPREHLVEVVTDYTTMEMRFEPQVVQIAPGDSVRWVNRRNSTHNVTTYPDGYPEQGRSFHSPFLQKAGQSWTMKLDRSGTYDYHCIPHIMVGMRGTIIVGERSRPDEMNRPMAAEVRLYRDRLLEFFEADELNEIPEFIRLKPRPDQQTDAARAGGSDA